MLSMSLMLSALSYAQTHVSFSDPDNWNVNLLREYVGETVVFDQIVYTCNNYSGLTASLHRVMSPTNQALPASTEYENILVNNNKATFTLSGVPGDQRMGLRIYGLVAKVNSTTSLTYVSSDAIYGSRADLQTLPSVDLVRDGDTLARHNVLVCTANLEYYLAEQYDASSSMGPDNQSEHEAQKKKVLSGLAKINADIYGLVEIQQGQTAIAEIASELTKRTGRHFSYIDDGTSANGTYTKSGYVYCSDVVRLHGQMKNNNSVVSNRKKMQCFELISNGERFIFSLNHFKAKSGASNATGLNADQGDGQGVFNKSRTDEANSVLSNYQTNRSYYEEEDLLVMGDLNAYAKEDPIMALINGGMTDLHRYFHADSSYSYTFRGTAGYLDHALCNSTLLEQVTGMAAYHINSDENDNYTYNGKWADETMFRYSDHDPVLVGLRLGAAFAVPDDEPSVDVVKVSFENGRPLISDGEGGHYVIASIDGRAIVSGRITSYSHQVDETLPQGLYILNIYYGGQVKRQKFYVF